MSRALNKLTAGQVKHAKPKDKQYKLSDGGGLILVVRPTVNELGEISASKFWQFRYWVTVEEGGITRKKEQTASFGAYPEVSLAKARERLSDAREDMRNGITPKDRQRLKRQEQIEAERALGHTFKVVAQSWYDKASKHWKNPKHRAQVWTTLETYAFPHFGKLPIADIRTSDVREVIEHIIDRGLWETAQRTYQRINAVFDEAIEKEYIEFNPAQVLQKKLFKARPEKDESNHFPALKPEMFSEFVQSFNKERESITPMVALAVELQMLTFVRPGELRGAKWDEFNFDENVWEIPASRMKMNRPHLVPLSTQTVTALKHLHALTGHSDRLFPHRIKGSACMSEATVNTVIKRMDNGKFYRRHTAHGFRSTASTYLNTLKQGDNSRFHPDAIERQLAHKEKDKIKAAYDHSIHWDERVKLMQEWANFTDQCGDTSGKVTPIRKVS